VLRCTSPTTGPDFPKTARALESIGHRAAFDLNWYPSHFIWQGMDPVMFLWDFRDRIYHVDCKDARLRIGNGRRGVLGSHLPWADPRRGWDFVSTGHGAAPWEDCFGPFVTIRNRDPRCAGDADPV
jgi:sugar phosphate isomerase/epimerase